MQQHFSFILYRVSNFTTRKHQLRAENCVFYTTPAPYFWSQIIHYKELRIICKKKKIDDLPQGYELVISKG
jgi:hypothetical protein